MPASDQWGDDTLHDLLNMSPTPKGLPTLHEGHIKIDTLMGLQKGQNLQLQQLWHGSGR